jgi:hypothetical protein
VPVSGPVEYHQLDQDPYSSGVQVAPLGPSPGATPQLIVEGFLHAMSVYQPPAVVDGVEISYEVARQYLTSEASSTWNPEAGVTIYADGYPATVTEDSAMLSAPAVGRISTGGVYRSEASNIRQDFKIVRDDAGEWRISQPPEGLLISKSSFSAGYTYFDRHYLAKDGRVMIPDPVWVAVSVDQSDQLLRALQLQGLTPSSWAAPLVQYAGRYEVASVEIQGSAILVEVSGLGPELDASKREQVVGQLALTSAQFGAYTQIQVSFTGLNVASWTIPDQPGTFMSMSDFANLAPVRRTTSPVVFGVSAARQALVRLQSEGGLVTIGEGFGSASHIAVSSDRTQAAEVVAEGTEIRAGAIAAPEPAVIRKGESLLRPGYSPLGELWTADSSGLDSLQVFGAELEELPEDVPEDQGTPEPTESAGQPTDQPSDQPETTPTPEPSGEAEGEVEGEGEPETMPAAVVGVPEGVSGKLIAFSIAPDGDRMAVAIESEAGPQVGVLRITRGTSISVDGWQPVGLTGMDVNHILDLCWSQASELFVLVIDHESAVSVLRVTQDSARISDIGPTDALNLVELASSPGYQLVARADDDSLYRFDTDFNWSHWVSGIGAVTYSG